MQEKVSFIKRLYRHYVAYHENGPRMLMYMGRLGVTLTPFLYLLRFTKSVPPFDDFWLRIVDVILFAALLPRFWTERWRPYYLPLSYATLTITLPFTWVFVALQNGGGTVAVANTFFATALVVLLADWRNAIAIWIIGASAGVALYLVVDPTPDWPQDYVGRLPLLLTFAVAIALIKRALEIETAAKTLKAEKKEEASRAAATQETVGFFAHELNTPLTTVRLAVSEVADRYIEPVAWKRIAEFHETRRGDVIAALRRAEQRAHFCQSLVDDFMKVALHHRLEETQDVLASSLIENLREHYPFEADERNVVEYIVDADFPITGSRELLRWVLSTVIKNALLAVRAQENPKILVQAIGDAPEFKTGFIRVSDNGCGIASEVLAGLTKQPVESTWANGAGSGMGLMFCRRVMQSCEGTISVASVLGQGTSVTLRFGPTERTDARPAAQRHPLEISTQSAQT